MIYAISYYLHKQKPVPFPLEVAAALHNQTSVSLSPDMVDITGKIQELKGQEKSPEEMNTQLTEYMHRLEKEHKKEVDGKELSLMADDFKQQKLHAYIANIHDKKLQNYLTAIHWETTTLTDDKLVAQLTATVLRYLGGITDLSFLLEFAEAMRLKYSNITNEKLRQAIDMLHEINEKIAGKQLDPTDENKLNSLIENVKKVIPLPKAREIDISSFQRENKHQYHFSPSN